MDTLALRHSRAITQRLIPLGLAAYLAVASSWARPGMWNLTESWVSTTAFLVASIGLLIRAFHPSAATTIISTVLLLLVALARAWAVAFVGLGYLVSDRIVGVTLWSFLALLSLNLGLTGLASLALTPERP